MKNNLNYLKNNLNLCGYTLLRVTNNKILIFKSFYKYTKCIYWINDKLFNFNCSFIKEVLCD